MGYINAIDDFLPAKVNLEYLIKRDIKRISKKGLYFSYENSDKPYDVNGNAILEYLGLYLVSEYFKPDHIVAILTGAEWMGKVLGFANPGKVSYIEIHSDPIKFNEPYVQLNDGIYIRERDMGLDISGNKLLIADDFIERGFTIKSAIKLFNDNFLEIRVVVWDISKEAYGLLKSLNIFWLRNAGWVEIDNITKETFNQAMEKAYKNLGFNYIPQFSLDDIFLNIFKQDLFNLISLR